MIEPSDPQLRAEWLQDEANRLCNQLWLQFRLAARDVVILTRGLIEKKTREELKKAMKESD